MTSNLDDPGAQRRSGGSPPHSHTPSPPHLVSLALFAAFLALYARTAAPSVLSGDSAEFQLAAVTLGVAHPTTYPLYTVLGHLMARLVPFGEPAYRVTLLSALCAAGTVALFFALARRILGATGPALAAALALGLSAGTWNAATLAEAYALLALLIVALALALTGHRPAAGAMPVAPQHLAAPPSTSRGVPITAHGPRSARRLWLAAMIGGLGFTHHGLFAITALPLLAAAVLWSAAQREAGTSSRTLTSHLRLAFSVQRLAFLLCFLLGMLPWLYPPLQFARYGPFDGQDYGLPRHYYWGAPQSYGAVLDLMTGGTIRRGIFRAPDAATALATLQLVGRRILFEFGPVGAALGLLGAWELARTSKRAFGGAAWVFFSTLAYLLLLGPAVADAPVFTLPMLLPWALWIGAGVAAGAAFAQRVWDSRTAQGSRPMRRAWFSLQRFALSVLLALTLGWGATRYRVSAKQHLWLYREFATATLRELPPGAAVIAHWEQGMALQYLHLAEGQRPDVWVDVVEPTDDAWGPRAERRYPDRPVYFVGPASSVAGIPVEPVREDEYATLFRLRR